MHRDVKVGLVIGVILVAVVAVLFFRRDEPPAQPLTRSAADKAVTIQHEPPLVEDASAPYPVPPALSGVHAPSSSAPSTASAAIKPATGPADPRVGQAATTTPGGPGLATAHTPAPITARLDAPQPVSPATSTAAPATAGLPRYTIQEGDRLYSLAERYYGQGALFTLIFDANQDVLATPDHLPVGKSIIIPERDAGNRGQSAPPDAAMPAGLAQSSLPPASLGRKSPRTYTVKEGDTLTKISREFYDDERMTGAIFAANEDVLESPERLKSGMVLRLP